MGVLQSFLETFREEDCLPPSEAIATLTDRCNRHLSARVKTRQIRSLTGRPNNSRRRDMRM